MNIQKDTKRVDFFKKIVKKYKFNLIYLNSVGGQDEIVFDGSSFLMDREGSVKHKCKTFFEENFSFSFVKRNFQVQIPMMYKINQMIMKIYMKR